ncbi:MAG: M48 family metallopeptidase [Elusimicrobiales bacterium]
MNIYEQQAKNRRLTYLILIIFFAFFLFIGFGFDYFYLQDYYYQTEKTFIPYGTIVSLILSTLLVINAFSNGIDMIVKSTGARSPYETLTERQLLNVVEEMSIAAGIPKPKVYIIPDRDLNAFATGFSPQNSYIFVTEGLLKELNRQELQAVIGHEMSHIRFHDIKLMTLIVVLMNTVALISDFTVRTNRNRSSSSRSRDRSGGIIFLIWIILLIISPIISRILAMAISRKREYLADAGSAELTRNPKALISALEKIRKAVQPTRAIKDSVSYLCITDPRGSLIEEKTGFLADLFATHPPMEKRILALKLMAYEQDKVINSVSQ